MKQLLSVPLIALLLSLSLYSCKDEVEAIYGCTNSLAENYAPNATIDNGSCAGIVGCTDSEANNYYADAIVNCGCEYDNVKRVLVEDYTGHHCGNCPRAAEEIHELACEYGDQIIPLAIHVGFFADVIFGAPFDNDYRTPIGNDFDAEFGNSNAGLPNGMVNRIKTSGSTILGYTEWGNKIDEVLSSAAEAEITISTSYDSGSRNVTATINTKILSSLEAGTYNLCIFLAEDSVISAQLDYDADPEEIEDYHHMHMLRDGFTDAWGYNLANSSIASGTSFNNEFDLTLNTDFNEKHCYVIAFLQNNDTKEVIQVNKTPYVN
jgi:thiol-disulfide isomerase/thioredoxin